jgi:methylphosphotriester-DNA--protein-cysteine methyltransferase
MVLDKIEELNYRPNKFARSLSVKNKKKIAVIMPSSSYFWNKVKAGIEFAGHGTSYYGIHIKFICFERTSSYFSDYFKKNIGINFIDYLARVRINRAAILLNETGISSTEIAFSCGSNNVTSFYNTFKKIKGMSPGDFKKNPAQKGIGKRGEINIAKKD